MFRSWDDEEEAQKVARHSFENHIKEILSEKGSIEFASLLKLVWGGHFLLSNYQTILEGLKHLENEGKIIINNKMISLATVTVLENKGLTEKSVWDIIKKEEEGEERKEFIRRYQQINPLC
ncbi:MAG: hypothetical protein ACTSUR_07030 [Candidatus Heimdallarchaeaceae archaeon]